MTIPRWVTLSPRRLLLWLLQLVIALAFRLRFDAGGSGDPCMRILGTVAFGATLGGCAIERAQIAQDARAQMIGMSKEQVLTCMGVPANKNVETVRQGSD